MSRRCKNITTVLSILLMVCAVLHIIQVSVVGQALELNVRLAKLSNCQPDRSYREASHTISHLFTHSFLWRNPNVTRALLTAAKFPLITAIMTVHNDELYLEPALVSVLNQSYPNLEVIIVDDASTDDSGNILQRIMTMYKGVSNRVIRILTQKVSRGTYFGKNLSILQARGSYVTFQDSDDISHVDRIMTQYLALSEAELERERINGKNIKSGPVIGSMVHYVRILTADYQIVLNRGAMSRPAYPSFMFNRNILLERVGFFDSVKVSADDEMFSRIRRVAGREGIVILPLAYYFATQHPGSATNGKSETRLDLSQRDIAAFLGEARLKYVENYQAWHNQAKDPIALYMPFPLLKRKFERPEAHCIRGDMVNGTVSVSVASNKNRTSLQKMIMSLIDQVDHIYVYLNDYETVPGWLGELGNHSKNNRMGSRARVTVVLGPKAFGNIMDNGKAYFLKQIKGYHFTCDDDLIYPPNYVQRMILALLHHDHKVIVGVHGINMTEAFVKNTSLHYYGQGTRNVSTFSKKLEYEYQADFLGTGTVAYHTDLLPDLRYEDFSVPGMMDIWLGVYARDRNIPMIVLTRENDWILEERAEVSIYRMGVRNDTVQTQVVRTRFLR